MITGIVVALPEELRTLTSQKIAKGTCAFITGNLLIAYSGTGRDNAINAAELLISKGASKLISWGCAGALSPNLTSGDLILPEKLLNASQQELSTNEAWLAFVKKNISLPQHSGNLIESLDIIAKSDNKNICYQQTQAIAVDMESVAIAETAQKANIPCLVIRTIADPAKMDLPDAVLQALNTEGEVVLSKLLIYVLTHPQQIPSLIRLGKYFRAATNKLKAVAKHLDIISGFDSNKTA